MQEVANQFDVSSHQYFYIFLPLPSSLKKKTTYFFKKEVNLYNKILILKPFENHYNYPNGPWKFSYKLKKNLIFLDSLSFKITNITYVNVLFLHIMIMLPAYGR